MTNSSMTLAAATSSTIQADGDPGDTFDLPAASGSGNLTLTASVEGKLIGLGSMAGFTGNFNAGADGVTAGTMTVRVSAASSRPGSVVTLSNGASLANRAGGGTPGVIELGALVGDTSTVLDGFTGGGTVPETVWKIGALNMTTQFSGTIVDGMGGPSGNPVLVPSSLTKVGTATLTLSNANNAYTGDTRVEDGILSITNPYLADTADVLLTNGAIFNLNFAATDMIDSLFINGVSQPTGTWGSPSSSALHKTALISGTGLLMVSTFVPPTLTGDYNDDGIVDAADYTVWRDNLGVDGAVLLHRDPANMGAVSQADYDSWKANFGAVAGAGAGALSLSGAVPEPSSGLLACLAVCGAVGAVNGRRRRRSA